MKADFELEIQHIAYMAIIGTVWLILTGLTNALFIDLYDSMPHGVETSIQVFWAIGGAFMVITIGIVVETVL